MLKNVDILSDVNINLALGIYHTENILSMNVTSNVDVANIIIEIKVHKQEKYDI